MKLVAVEGPGNAHWHGMEQHEYVVMSDMCRLYRHNFRRRHLIRNLDKCVVIIEALVITRVQCLFYCGNGENQNMTQPRRLMQHIYSFSLLLLFLLVLLQLLLLLLQVELLMLL